MLDYELIEKKGNELVGIIGKEINSKIVFKIDEEDIVNACVKKTVDKTYLIIFYKGLFKKIEEKVTDSIDLIDDWRKEQFPFNLENTIFKFFSDGIENSQLMNTIALMIFDNILWHELGHIILGHCDKFASGVIEYNNYGATINLCQQAMEMDADIYAIFRSINVQLNSIKFFRDEEIKIYESLNYKYILNVLFPFVMALSIQFSMFENDSNVANWKYRTHPNVLTRMIYSTYYTVQYMSDYLSQKTKKEVHEIDMYLVGMLEDGQLEIDPVVESLTNYKLKDYLMKNANTDQYDELMKSEYHEVFEFEPLVKNLPLVTYSYASKDNTIGRDLKEIKIGGNE